MRWLLLILFFAVMGADTVNTDSVCMDFDRAKRIIANNAKQQKIEKNIKEINGELDSIIRVLQDTIK